MLGWTVNCMAFPHMVMALKQLLGPSVMLDIDILMLYVGPCVFH